MQFPSCGWTFCTIAGIIPKRDYNFSHLRENQDEPMQLIVGPPGSR